MGLNTYPCSPFPPSTADMEKGDVTEQQKALIETIPGKAQKADIAPEFSTETAYNTGDLVYYNGALYEFTADHAAGAWSTDDTQAATINGSLDQLKSGLTNLIKFDSVTGPTSTSGVLSSSIADSRKILMAWAVNYMVNPYTNSGVWKFVIGDASSVNGYVLVKETNVTVNYAYLDA